MRRIMIWLYLAMIWRWFGYILYHIWLYLNYIYVCVQWNHRSLTYHCLHVLFGRFTTHVISLGLARLSFPCDVSSPVFFSVLPSGSFFRYNQGKVSCALWQRPLSQLQHWSLRKLLSISFHCSDWTKFSLNHVSLNQEPGRGKGCESSLEFRGNTICM